MFLEPQPKKKSFQHHQKSVSMLVVLVIERNCTVVNHKLQLLEARYTLHLVSFFTVDIIDLIILIFNPSVILINCQCMNTAQYIQIQYNIVQKKYSTLQCRQYKKMYYLYYVVQCTCGMVLMNNVVNMMIQNGIATIRRTNCTSSYRHKYNLLIIYSLILHSNMVKLQTKRGIRYDHSVLESQLLSNQN